MFEIDRKRTHAISHLAALALTWTLAFGVGNEIASAADSPAPKLNTDDIAPSCRIKFRQTGHLIQVEWPVEDGRKATLTFDLDHAHPLIKSVAIAGGDREATIARGIDPTLRIRVGKRDLAKRDGWTIFFDRMQEKPSDEFTATILRDSLSVTGNSQRATLTLGEVRAGPFRGVLRWTFYADNAFILQEAVLKTNKQGVAYLYDAGLVFRGTRPARFAWRDPLGAAQSETAASIESLATFAVRGRTACAEFDRGCLSVFPPPHRFFYPLDFSDNLQNVWIGPPDADESLGLGIRHDPQGDNRYVPWFNAPPESEQQMGLFLMLSDLNAEHAQQQVARLTRGDRFEPLPGHTVFSSHYHVEHTRELLAAQSQPAEANDRMGKLPSGDSYRIPSKLIEPGFSKVFKDHGIDIVHLAEFHFGRTPRMKTEERLRHLELLHAECARLSNPGFLLLPGEEPNVHLGGHWISFFPQPVYWVLNRPEGTPFVTEHPSLGSVYHVGEPADVLRLLRAEFGLAWTAHPRIKGSTGYPDRYKDQLFFQSDRFLGAAWKAMPADLAKPRLGSRVLELLDDMSNWGDPKYSLGEVDVFKIEPDHELYGHLNVNYLRMDSAPRFEDGWHSVLDALRDGKFFVTTGEVLIPEFSVDGKLSGERVTIEAGETASVHLELQWTFPLDRVEIVTGNGSETKHQRVDLTTTGSYGKESFAFDVDVSDARWIRAEVWDIATNGAFTQPVWLAPPTPQ